MSGPGDGAGRDAAARGTNRIVRITLDEKSVVRRAPEIEHERAVAIFDLIEDNSFVPAGDLQGPFALHLSVADNRLVMDIRREDDQPLSRVVLPLSPFRRIVKDYFEVCESYFQAIRTAPPSRIEAIDMGRRGLHDEGSRLLKSELAGRIDIDHDTARRLFTLLCVLHIRG